MENSLSLFYWHHGQMESVADLHKLLAKYPEGWLLKQKLPEAVAREQMARNNLTGKDIGTLTNGCTLHGSGYCKGRSFEMATERKDSSPEGMDMLEDGKAKTKTVKMAKEVGEKLAKHPLVLKTSIGIGDPGKWREAFESAIDRDHFDLTDWRRKPLNQQRINFIIERLKFVAYLGTDPHKIILRDDLRIREKYAIRREKGEGQEKLVLKRNPRLEFVPRELWFDTLMRIVDEQCHLSSRMAIYHFVQKHKMFFLPIIHFNMFVNFLLFSILSIGLCAAQWPRWEERHLDCTSRPGDCVLSAPNLVKLVRNATRYSCRREPMPQGNWNPLVRNTTTRLACPIACEPEADLSVIQKRPVQNKNCQKYYTYGKYRDRAQGDWYLWLAEPCIANLTTHCRYNDIPFHSNQLNKEQRKKAKTKRQNGQ